MDWDGTSSGTFKLDSLPTLLYIHKVFTRSTKTLNLRERDVIFQATKS